MEFSFLYLQETIFVSIKKSFNMKKLLVLAVSGLLFSGAAFAGGKECSKGKECCKKEGKACCKKDGSQEKPAADKPKT